VHNLFGAVGCFGAGLVAFYFGLFHADAVCNDQAHTNFSCHFQAALANEYGFLYAGAVFFLLGLWMLYRMRPRRM
jgi:hypothetical protein